MYSYMGLTRLSWDERIQRCYFLVTEALLDRALVQHVLLDTLSTFTLAGIEYPYVRPAELKPGGLAPTVEHAMHNTALFLLVEDTLPPELKPYIRVRRSNELLQKNLQRFTIPLTDTAEGVAGLKEITSVATVDALRPLFQLDQALVVQRKEDKKAGPAYVFSNFHVKIDAVLDAVIEDYGVELRYLSKSLYENGEDYAALLEQKFFEQFGMKTTASGRRTAAVVAHRLLVNRVRGLHAVYAGSCESRCIYKIHHDGNLSRVVLANLAPDEIEEILTQHKLTMKDLETDFLLTGPTGEKAVLFYVRNARTSPAIPPPDRKLRREISSAERWISTDQQLILPLPTAVTRAPLEWNWLYRTPVAAPKPAEEA